MLSWQPLNKDMTPWCFAFAWWFPFQQSFARDFIAMWTQHKAKHRITLIALKHFCAAYCLYCTSSLSMSVCSLQHSCLEGGNDLDNFFLLNRKWDWSLKRLRKCMVYMDFLKMSHLSIENKYLISWALHVHHKGLSLSWLPVLSWQLALAVGRSHCFHSS